MNCNCGSYNQPLDGQNHHPQISGCDYCLSRTHGMSRCSFTILEDKLNEILKLLKEKS